MPFDAQQVADILAVPVNRLEALFALPGSLLPWYDAHARVLPWRSLPTAYRVWVSEIMLQQTRVEAVLPYFERFLAALPTVEALAGADEGALLKLWEGLGYYSRARNLQKAARMVVERFGGELPRSLADLLTLPGIGPYTAGAIASIAHGVAVPAVDGNVLRVAARLTASGADVANPSVRRAVEGLMAAAMPTDRPGDFNQALMDLGATVCLPNGQPRCEDCPAAALCAGRALGVAATLPVKAAKAPRRVERRTVLAVVGEGGLLLRQREPRGLLAGLWELPGVEGWIGPEEAAALAEGWGLTVASEPAPLPDVRHVFSHVEWLLKAWRVEVHGDPPVGWRWADRAALAELAVPSPFAPHLRALGLRG